MKSEIKVIILAFFFLLYSDGIALCQTNELIINKESYAEFSRLKEKYKFIPEIESLPLLNYERLVMETHKTEVDSKGNVMKEETVRTIDGSIDRIMIQPKRQQMSLLSRLAILSRQYIFGNIQGKDGDLTTLKTNLMEQ